MQQNRFCTCNIFGAYKYLLGANNDNQANTTLCESHIHPIISVDNQTTLNSKLDLDVSKQNKDGWISWNLLDLRSRRWLDSILNIKWGIEWLFLITVA